MQRASTFRCPAQPEGIQQVVVSGFSNLDTCNHVMPPEANYLISVGLIPANW